MCDWSDTRRRAFDSPVTDDIAHDYKIESIASDSVLPLKRFDSPMPVNFLVLHASPEMLYKDVI